MLVWGFLPCLMVVKDEKKRENCCTGISSEYNRIKESQQRCLETESPLSTIFCTIFQRYTTVNNMRSMAPKLLHLLLRSKSTCTSQDHIITQDKSWRSYVTPRMRRRGWG